MWNRRGQQIGQPFKSSKGSVYSYPGNTGSVYSVAISTDGQTIISGNADATVRTWNIKLDTWLKAACERLANHPVFKSSVTADEKEAKETCKPYLR
jgi:WD40 repeat protein